MDLCEQGTVSSIACFLNSENLNVGFEDRFNENALHYMLRRKSFDNISILAEKILTKNASLVNKIGKDGKSLLMKASEKACSELVEVFIRFGANVNFQQENGNTALHELVSFENKSDPTEISKCLNLMLKGN